MKLRLVSLLAAAIASNASAQEATLVEREGKVVLTKVGSRPAPAEIGASLVARDKLGTAESSRAVLKMSEKWFARIDEETDVEITPGAFAASDKEALKIALGGAFIYSREEEGELKIQTPSATGGLRGTQVIVRVFPGGRTLMKVLEGEVDLSNAQGRVTLSPGDVGEATPGKAPRKTAVIDTRNLLQWALYYPAVLEPTELKLSQAEQTALAASLSAYQEGNLLDALARLPRGYAFRSPVARLYHASVLLATGQVEDARVVMKDVPANLPGKRSLDRMIAAVLFVKQPDVPKPTTASEAMAESYYQQSRSNLEAARDSARLATELAPESGYTWTRLAELEFSFGRTRQATRALNRGLKLTPRNAQAHTLRGYLYSADNRIRAARESFEHAVKLDGGLGNAWLGLGLTKIKQGHREEGRSDLQTAATVEPNRSFFYSYHAKALSMDGENRLARKDLDLAKTLDPKDPTPWLYSAIQDQQEYRYNEAIDAMQESLRLNDNRRVYRSQFLLDQDRAVRNVNLAKIYQNAGMTELSVREATRAVENDYTNAAAHLFLANSFDALRDPKRISLRYETAWANELLLSNLLSPVGGGPLSQFVSQQEYSKLLESDGAGAMLFSEWRDNGTLDQRASIFATYGKLSLGIDFAYYYDNGFRPNNAFSQSEVYWQLKYQVSPDDIFYTLGKWTDLEGGDVFQTYDRNSFDPSFDNEEKQEPGVQLFGWNHRWAPGVHTLLLGGRLAFDQTLTARDTSQLLTMRDSELFQPGLLRSNEFGFSEFASDDLRNAKTPPLSLSPTGFLQVSDAFKTAIKPYLGKGPIDNVFSDQFDFDTFRRFEAYTGEIQHIWQTRYNTLILGGRLQAGEVELRERLDAVNPFFISSYTSPASGQEISADFERRGLYAYDFFQPTRWLTLITGVAWDHLDRPRNFRSPPFSEDQVEHERISGKFGFTLEPSRWLKIRGVYTEGLGGVAFDDSVRLEPVQLAGFSQAYRTVISESLIGSVEAPVYKNWGLSLEGSLPTRTWWGASVNILEEDLERSVGVFDYYIDTIFPAFTGAFPSQTQQTFAYREEVFTATLNQLLGREFALGATYRFTRAELRSQYPEFPLALIPEADAFDEGKLHELSLYANWNSPSGWFARAEANWYAQDLDGSAGGLRLDGLPGDDFWMFNAQVGYRFGNNRHEISAGVLNITDNDYQLHPLTYYRELPRERTFFVRCRLSF